MKLNYKLIAVLGLTLNMFFGCGGTSDILSTPIENIDYLSFKGYRTH